MGWRGAHCPPANYNSIGICFEGSYMLEDMPQTQFNVGLKLIADINSRYGINAIYGHKDLYSTSCPGDKFPLDSMRNTLFTTIAPVVNLVQDKPQIV